MKKIIKTCAIVCMTVFTVLGSIFSVAATENLMSDDQIISADAAINKNDGRIVYAPVLESWATAIHENFGYSEDTQNVKAYPFIPRALPNEFAQARYAYTDIDGNGTCELLIAAFGDSEYKHIIDIFTVHDGKPVRLFEGIEDYGFWSRYRLDFAEDGGTFIVSALSGKYTNIKFYKVAENGYQAEFIEGIRFETSSVVDYDNVMGQYLDDSSSGFHTNLNWQPFSPIDMHAEEADTWQDAYAKLLRASSGKEFFICDIDSDKTPELLSGGALDEQGSQFIKFVVYSYKNGVVLNIGIVDPLRWGNLSIDGEGGLLTDIYRGADAVETFRYYIDNGVLHEDGIVYGYEFDRDGNKIEWFKDANGADIIVNKETIDKYNNMRRRETVIEKHETTEANISKFIYAEDFSEETYAWQDAYAELLRTSSGKEFYICDIDGGKTPELLVGGELSEYAKHAEFIVYSYKNGAALNIGAVYPLSWGNLNTDGAGGLLVYTYGAGGGETIRFYIDDGVLRKDGAVYGYNFDSGGNQIEWFRGKDGAETAVSLKTIDEYNDMLNRETEIEKHEITEANISRFIYGEEN